jgi:hypothetical protein
LSDTDRFTPVTIKAYADFLSGCYSDPKINEPTRAVEVLGKTLGLKEQERTSVLENLLRGGDYSRWGAVNAVTRAAEGAESYDRATFLEETGGRLLELPTTDWRRIAEAA